jgi:hypothetical protein
MIAEGVLLSAQGPVTFNVLNTSARTPGNPEVSDEAHRVRLYEEVCRIMQEVSTTNGFVLSKPGLHCSADAAYVHMPHLLILGPSGWLLPGLHSVQHPTGLLLF